MLEARQAHSGIQYHAAVCTLSERLPDHRTNWYKGNQGNKLTPRGGSLWVKNIRILPL
jgi:hypothetical protein